MTTHRQHSICMDWSVVLDLPSVRMLTCGSLVCMNVKQQGDVEGLVRSFELQGAVADQHGAVSQMVVLEFSNIGRFNPVIGRHVAGQVSKIKSRLKGAAIIVLGDGLGARLLRGTILTSVFLSGSGRHKVFSSIREGLRWLQSLPDQHEDVQLAQLQPLLQKLELDDG